jgi:hypothetical protein
VYVGSETGDPQHEGEGQESMGEVVGVESVSVEGVMEPGVPNRNIKTDKCKKPSDRQILRKQMAQLSDGNHKDQIEEEL